MESTAKQRSAIAIMIRQLGLQVYMKEALVEGYSSGRTTSIKELTFDEAGALIGQMKEDLGIEDSPKDKMQRKILSLAHEMGWKTPGGKVDVARVNSWCLKYGTFHKPFRAHHESELPSLVTQFEQVHLHFLNSI